MKNLLNVCVALIGFALSSACFTPPPPAVELNIDNAKRLMKGGAEVKNGLTVSSGVVAVTSTSTFTGGVVMSSALNKGSLLTVDAGTGTSTGTVTVTSGAQCACSPATSVVFDCSVSSTTLTGHTAADETLAYVCF